MVTRILVAEASDLALLGIVHILQQHPQFQIVGQARCLAELLKQAAATQPDMIVFGDLAAEVAVARIIEQLKQNTPKARFILMTNALEGYLIHDLLQVGLSSYLYKGDELETGLPLALEFVRRQRLYLSPTANAEYLVTLQSPLRNSSLDVEARTVLQLLAQGLSIQSIATQLQVPLRRIYWVRQKLRQRFGANTNEHLISMAVTEGFTDRDA